MSSFIKFFRWIEIILRSFYFVLAVVLIGVIAFILGGYPYLAMGVAGSDTASAISTLAWIDKYFPNVPFWYPLAGGGMSLTHAYPIFGFYLISFLHKILPLNLIQTARVMGFISVPLMSLGIYAFVALRLKRQTTALIAAILYLISPLAWVWLFDWGFYAESIAYIFVMPTILFWDLFFMNFIKDPAKPKVKIYLALGVIFHTLTIAIHFSPGAVLFGFFGFYVLGYLAMEKGSKKTIFVRGVKALFIYLAITLLASFFIVYPFYRYQGIASVAGLSGVSLWSTFEQVKLNELPISQILGFHFPAQTDYFYAHRNISFPAIVSIMAFIGMLISIKNPRKFTFSLFVLYSLFLTTNANFIYWAFQHLPSFVAGTLFVWRPTFIIVRVLVPVLAAVAVVEIWDLLLFWIKGKPGLISRKLVPPIGGLILVGFFLFQYGNIPKSKGIYDFGAFGFDPLNIWQGSLGGKKTSIKELTLTEFLSRLEVNGSFSPSEVLKQSLERISEENPNARFDFSPSLSPFSMVAPYYNLDRNISQIHSYIASSGSLILRFFGQQSGAFYSRDPFYNQDPILINDWTHWFGINYIFLEGTATEIDANNLEKAGWHEWDKASHVYKFSENNNLVDLSTKPAILVISQRDKGGYDQVLKIAGYGAISYKEYSIVWGKESLDDYSLEDLKNFDVVLLHGYNYSNFSRTNSLLSSYVNEGGKLFIDTGWQYTVPDWQTKDNQSLDILPFKTLYWDNLGKTSDYLLEDKEIGGKVDASQFGPLIYGSDAWQVSTSQKSDLKDGAKTVLSVKGSPLVVSYKFGKGKIIWSGMNIFPHAKKEQGVYKDEVVFIGNLFSWLTKDTARENIAVSYIRTNPDRVEFTIKHDAPKGANLLFKEAYYPDFHAFLSKNNIRTKLNVYRAGPGLVLINLPRVSAGDKVIYQYEKPWAEVIPQVISFTVLFILIPLLLIDGFLKKEKSIFSAVLNKRKKISIASGLKNTVKGIGTDLAREEEDY